MDLSTTLSVVQTILAVIQTLQSVYSISKCKSELDDLLGAVDYVRAALEDADAKQDSIDQQDKIYVKQLQDFVYDADDVLDEFLTLAKQNRLRSNKLARPIVKSSAVKPKEENNPKIKETEDSEADDSNVYDDGDSDDEVARMMRMAIRTTQWMRNQPMQMLQEKTQC